VVLAVCVAMWCVVGIRGCAWLWARVASIAPPPPPPPSLPVPCLGLRFEGVSAYEWALANDWPTLAAMLAPYHPASVSASTTSPLGVTGCHRVNGVAPQAAGRWAPVGSTARLHLLSRGSRLYHTAAASHPLLPWHVSGGQAGARRAAASPVPDAPSLAPAVPEALLHLLDGVWSMAPEAAERSIEAVQDWVRANACRCG
jgi:hypothetical protein